jgi:hypothetical protein
VVKRRENKIRTHEEEWEESKGKEINQKRKEKRRKKIVKKVEKNL